VEILEDEHGHYKKDGLTLGKVYKILWEDEEGDNGDEMIEADSGVFLCSFSLYLRVKWLKEK
jgi:hypothetical protein